MELYLDSANLKEIEEGFKLGFLNGLTTTPTFMQREGIADVDGMIVKLSKMVPVLQIEALGNTAEEVLQEEERNPPGTDEQLDETNRDRSEPSRDTHPRSAGGCHSEMLRGSLCRSWAEASTRSLRFLVELSH